MLKDILKQELIGLDIEVTASKNKSLAGARGKIVDETKNTLKLKAGTRVVALMKNAIMFTAKIDGKTVEIDGACLVGRSEDRIKK